MNAATPGDDARGITHLRFADAATMAAQLAKRVSGYLAAGIAARGRASLIVSGGKSPVLFFEALSHTEIDWSRVAVGLADERVVPPTSADSNAHLVAQHLLVHRAAAARLVPLYTGNAPSGDVLAERMRAMQSLVTPVDIVVLGMGEDGHTASLFPGAVGLRKALDATQPPALVEISPPVAAHRRISLNVSALLNARRLLIMIQGEAKAQVMERALRSAASETSHEALPIASVLAHARIPVDIAWAP